MVSHAPQNFNAVSEKSDKFFAMVDNLSAEDFLKLQFAVEKRENSEKILR